MPRTAGLDILNKKFHNLPDGRENRRRSPSAASLLAIPDVDSPAKKIAKASVSVSRRKSTNTASSGTTSAASKPTASKSTTSKAEAGVVGRKVGRPASVVKSSKPVKVSSKVGSKVSGKPLLKSATLKPKRKARARVVPSEGANNNNVTFAELTTKELAAREKARIAEEKRRLKDLVKNEKGKEKRRMDREKAKLKELRVKLKRLKKRASITKQVQAEMDQISQKIEKQKEKVVRKEIASEEQILQVGDM